MNTLVCAMMVANRLVGQDRIAGAFGIEMGSCRLAAFSDRKW